MEDLDKNDFDDERKFGKDETVHNLKDVQDRQATYKEYRDQLEESGEKQLSLTDPDSKLMKFNDGFNVGYNVQTAVEADSHLIATYNVTTNPTDHAEITETLTRPRMNWNMR